MGNVEEKICKQRTQRSNDFNLLPLIKIKESKMRKCIEEIFVSYRKYLFINHHHHHHHHRHNHFYYFFYSSFCIPFGF